MSRGVRDQASDKLLGLIQVAAPEEHGGRVDHGDTQIDRVIALHRRIDRLPRRLGCLVWESTEPKHARKQYQCADPMIITKEVYLVGFRHRGLRHASLQVAKRSRLISG